jgi:exonuclease VII small subunit
MKNPISLAPALPAACTQSHPAAPTGQPLPVPLRRAIECLGGYDMRDVRVHYDSPAPARVGARAFACGSAIHLGPGAESALAHEAWHVVQQKQGRTPATTVLDGTALNDDPRLEVEADLMGALALRLCNTLSQARGQHPRQRLRRQRIATPTLQRLVTINGTRYSGMEEDFLKLCKYVNAALYNRLGDAGLTLFRNEIMAQILVDFVQEDIVFVNDNELLAEIAIRNVGYQAETAMRKLMNDNMKPLAKNLVRKHSRTEAARAQWAKDEVIQYSDRKYKSFLDFDADLYQIAEEADDGFLKWQSASYLNKPSASPIENWLLEKTPYEPMAMNCWEGTLYALVKSGAVDKSYLSWANTTIKTRPDWTPAGFTAPITQFLLATVNIRDGYWCVPSANSLKITLDCLPQKTGWTDTQCVCIPADFTIPRGRLIIFNFASHVAISTGRKYLIASEAARQRFGTMMGHGILELDKPDEESAELRTISETTLEDLINMAGTYLQHVMIAPFPRIETDGVTQIQPPYDPTLSVEELIAKIISESSGKIKKDIETTIKEANKLIAKLNKSLATFTVGSTAYNDCATKISQQEKAIANAESNVNNAWITMVKGSKTVKVAIADAELARKKGTVPLPDRLLFPYRAVDPYHGLVVFPRKS